MRRTWIGRIRPRAVVAVAALAVSGSLSAAAPAAAAGLCGTGYTFYTARYMYHGSTAVGQVALYTAGGGNLCAVGVQYGPEVGVYRYRTVQLWDGNEADSWSGNSRSGAGPTYTHTDGSCTSMYAAWGTADAIYAERLVENVVCWAST